ncbi:hypothetical protein GOBAR_AA27099 [Gossypium barbadense]|uniref:Myb/SANT-like domain-containing protein n=1 Tax=Gossypium barbadense TaxID=3634 RepID=A0A2P5WR80_GOSBA|nr:hypothetical protein GOBAR_AA27099 [Gossypium barbadense]
MGNSNKKGTSKKFRWTKPMERLFLEILAEEAQKRNKPSNTFKTVSINRVVEAISERFQVQCDAKHVENHLRTVKKQWQIICTIRGESDRATYDVAVMAHKKYEPFLNKSIDHYDEMALVVGKDMAIRSFARTFADIDLDDGDQDSVPIDYDNEETEEVRTKVSSSGTSKHKRKNAQESVVDEQIKFVVSHESEAKAFLVVRNGQGSLVDGDGAKVIADYPEVIKALAVKLGVELAVKRKYDCLPRALSITPDVDGSSSLYFFRWTGSFPKFNKLKSKHIKREANRVADWVASHYKRET